MNKNNSNKPGGKLFDPHGNRPLWIAAFIVSITTLIVYIPSLQNGFVNWDDHKYVYENPNIRSMDPAFLFSFYFSNWHPLTMFSLALDYAIWELDPFGYHLTNILLHSFNTFLVFILVVRLIKCGLTQNSKLVTRNFYLIAASVTALLFGIHPLHVESVAWISERKDVLCAFFFLLSLLSYLSYASSEGHKKHVFYITSLISFALALMSKPMAVTLPLVLLILDFYPLNRLTTGLRGVLPEKLPFFALSVLSSIVTVWAHHSSNAMVEEALESAEPFLFTAHSAMRACMFYLAKMALPFNLSPFYPRIDVIDPFSFGYIEYIVYFILLLLITYITLRSLKKNRLYSAVWFYYIATLIPVIGIVPIGAHSAADRYTYLPSLGPFLLFGVGIGHIFARSSKKEQAALVAALIFLFGTLTSKTITQIPVWKDSVTLWSRVIKYFPYSTKAYINRGGAYVGLDDYQQAIKDLDTAIRLNPMSFDAHIARGNAYNRFDDYQQAIKDYSKAIKLTVLESRDSKQTAKAYINRGATYTAMGEYILAIKDFNEAIKLDPGYVEAYNLRGAVYVNTGDYRQAIKAFDTAIELDPLSADAYYNRGTGYRILGDNHKAVNDFSTAISFNPQYAAAYNNRGNAYRDLGKYQQAIEDYSMAIKLNPKDAIAYKNRGIAYRNLGNNGQAMKDFKKADELSLDIKYSNPPPPSSSSGYP